MAIKLKTEKELIIEFRNAIASRMIQQEANMRYFEIVIQREKPNTQEIVDARNNFALNQHNHKKDVLFLKCIDEMLTK